MRDIIDPSERNPPARRRTAGDEFSSGQPSAAPHLGHHTKPTKSKINTKSPEYIANYKEMLEMVDQLNERLLEATFQGADRLLELHHKRGSILGMYIYRGPQTRFSRRPYLGGGSLRAEKTLSILLTNDPLGWSM